MARISLILFGRFECEDTSYEAGPNGDLVYVNN